MKKGQNKNSGQVLMVILLIVLVAMLAGLTLFSRSLSESSAVISQEEKDKTFNRAEEGSSKYLSFSAGDLGDFADGTSSTEEGIDVSYSNLGEGINLDISRNSVLALDVQIGSDEDIYVSWEECNMVLFELWNDQKLIGYDIRYSAPQYCATMSDDIKTSGSKINADQVSISNGLYKYSIPSSFGGESVRTVRVKPLYADSSIELSGDGQLLSFYEIASEESGTTDTSIRQRIEQDRSGDFLPEIFDYVLYSGESIVKN